MHWTNEWPTEEGYYWFWGYPYGKSIVEGRGLGDSKPSLSVIHVSPISNGMMVTRDGSFWFSEEWNRSNEYVTGGHGLFLKMDEPDMPTLKETT